jgi:circadian clock protein KaiC
VSYLSYSSYPKGGATNEKAIPMNHRITTGVAGLDTILCGGFLRHNSILLKGAPGTGKTLLGTQILLHGLLAEGEGAIICSFEQFPQQLFRDMNSFGMDLERLAEDERLSVFFLKPEDLISPGSSSQTPLLSRIFTLAEERGVRRMLVDSISHFNRVSPDPVTCRAVLLQFINAVKSTGITPILTAEMGSATERDFSFEEYLVDEVVLLHNDLAGSTASLPQRAIEVTKTRGHDHLRGRHPFRILDTGIAAYPHVLPKPFGPDELAGTGLQAVGSGVAGVDRLIGGGFPRGTSTILAGMSGTYKTTLACQFLAEGARQGERGLLITFEETPQLLIQMQAQRGVDLAAGIDAGLLKIAHYVPKECCLDAIFADLCAELDTGLTRVVIDSLDDFERALDQPEATKEYLGMFLAALTRARATSILTQKLHEVSSVNPIADIRFTSMVDTVIYLGNVEIESRIRKVISVLKSRGSAAQSDLCEIRCGPAGLEVTDKFHGLSGILQGTAHGQYKQTVENIFQPLYFIRDFAQMGAAEGMDPEARRKILADILGQVDTLDSALKDRFGFDPEEAKKA